MTVSVFMPDAKAVPYWWDALPAPGQSTAGLPAEADVLVIGSGYTGLHAALATARGGRSTVVIDSEAAGFGCSTRNGGQVSTSIKPSFAELSRRYGREHAADIVREGQRSLAWLGEFVAAERIACDFHLAGRFHAAHSPRQWELLVRQADEQPPDLAVPMRLVPREAQREEIGTDAYFGGAVFPLHAALDPALYHRGLLDRARTAGASIVAHCRAEAIARIRTGFTVTTARGACRARDVVVATNGYTGPATPWLRRRVIPIGSYMIATEELPAGLMDRLLPKRRTVSDTRKVVYYYRPSPDGRRILFGGRVSQGETDPYASGPLLHAELARIFPALAGIRISHSWFGYVGYTFDTLPHIGRHEGVHYAMGYCGSGIGMASYLGIRLGQQVLGDEAGRTAFDAVPFPTRPFYFGKPWFLAPSVRYYRWRDARS
jgi:glycine/D-amino acid oxidase-like deaminating enzyme